MKYYTIETSDKLDFNVENKPYVIKNYANNWYAYKNWSFDFLKKLKQ